MEHRQKTFSFVDRTGQEIKLRSKPYTFKIESVLEERFGKGVPGRIFTEKAMEFDVTLKDVSEDFPRLLEGETNNIDWEVQEYDEVLAVYAFFLQYKKNATVRQLEYNKEMLAMEMQQVQEILNSMPEIISQIANLKGTQDT